jgi:dienelactone hydrolase
MRRRLQRLAWVLALIGTGAGADAPPLRDYFRAEVERIEKRPLMGVTSAEEWKARRPELQRQLREMLGLDPEPERTDLRVTVTGTVERPEFVIEKLHFQSRPGLYVTANLYRPKEPAGRLPAILYLCGHAKVEKDGVIYGNKVHYQHHAVWYAANGYVCLVLDTLQLGELPGLHHGTYREGMWWWQSRGYTPAGVEAWNAIRAIDYLVSRDDVDPNRIGVTGRSGGGATSWWVGALDDRVAAVAPVAGITDLRDHIIEPNADGHYDMGVIEGHCDCMYFVNTHRWGFDTVAALVAPKALLVENTDHDPIFPEAGVRRIFGKLETVYEWYGARDRLGLVIGKGGHVDSEEIRRPSFAFFEKRLKGREVKVEEIEEPDRSVPVEMLKVLAPGETPPDCRNATIHESFVPAAEIPPVPATPEEWGPLYERLNVALRDKVLGGWPTPEQAGPLDVRTVLDETRLGWRMRCLEYSSQPGVRLRTWLFTRAGRVTEHLLISSMSDQDSRSQGMLGFGYLFTPDDELKEQPLFTNPPPDGGGLALVETRGFGPRSWPASRDVHVRRRFVLLGQTLDGMRAYDLVRARAVLGQLPDLSLRYTSLYSGEEDGPACLLAALMEPGFSSLSLSGMDARRRERAAFLNLDRHLGWPQAAALLNFRPMTIHTGSPEDWRWDRELAKALGEEQPWPEVREP